MGFIGYIIETRKSAELWWTGSQYSGFLKSIFSSFFENLLIPDIPDRSLDRSDRSRIEFNRISDQFQIGSRSENMADIDRLSIYRFSK